MKDALGDRMKDQYESRTKTFLPRRTYAIIRLDGKAFHTYTRGLDRPYDEGLLEDMNKTAIHLCENIQGAKFAYVQSDEISILITDFEKLTTDAWFDYSVQKITSISASMAASKFNQLRILRAINVTEDANWIHDYVESLNLADFDARVFTIPDPFEVHNHFVWRQQDATRNSISMGAQSLYSHNELNGKSTSEMQDMMHEKGVNWNDYPARFKRGGFICKNTYNVPHPTNEDETVTRSRWECVDPPIFTKETEFTFSRIPVIAGKGVMSLLDVSNIPA